MPIASAISPVLLALRNTSDSVWGRFDHGRPGVGVTEWAVILGATVLLVAVMCVSSWRAKRQKAQFLNDSKVRMFGELAQAHRFDRAQRRLLKRLAAAQDVGETARLFVEPEFFDAERVPLALKTSVGELTKMRRELFG